MVGIIKHCMQIWGETPAWWNRWTTDPWFTVICRVGDLCWILAKCLIWIRGSFRQASLLESIAQGLGHSFFTPHPRTMYQKDTLVTNFVLTCIEANILWFKEETTHWNPLHMLQQALVDHSLGNPCQLMSVYLVQSIRTYPTPSKKCGRSHLQ